MKITISITSLLFICLCVFLSKIFWYDLRVASENARDAGLVIMFVVYSIALAPFMVLAFITSWRSILESRVLQAFIGIGVLGAFTAFHYKSIEGSYFPQDVFKLAFLPTAAMLSYRVRHQISSGFLWGIGWVALVLLISKCVFSYLYSTRGLYYGTALDMFPFCIFGSFYACRGGSRGPKGAALAALSLFLVIIGQKRTLLVCLVAVVLYIGAMGFRYYRSTLLVLFATCALLIGVFALVTDISPVEVVMSRFLEHGVDVRETTRGEEVRIVYSTLSKRDQLALVLGLGHGSTFDMPTKSSVEKHSVHFTPAALHLRYGVFGWLLLILILAAVFQGGSRRDSLQEEVNLVALRAYTLSAAVASLGMFGFVDDMIVGMAVGFNIPASKKRSSVDECTSGEHKSGSSIQMHRKPLSSEGDKTISLPQRPQPTR